MSEIVLINITGRDRKGLDTRFIGLDGLLYLIGIHERKIKEEVYA